MSPDEAITTLTSELNSTWVIVSAVLVIFMQAGFLFLEVGFSRGKNAGSGVAKILVNFSIATIAWWACGFALAFGGDGTVFGDSGFFLKYGSEISDGSLGPGPVHRLVGRLLHLPVRVLRRLARDRLGHDARAPEDHAPTRSSRSSSPRSSTR